jgi:Domain of unknown function DUF11/PKD-like domain
MKVSSRAFGSRLLFVLLITVAWGTLARGATVKWASAVSGNWNDSTRWDTASVPTSADTVLIDVPGTYTVTVNAAASAASLSVGAASGVQTLSMPSGFTLTVTGTTSILANGELLLTSGVLTGGNLSVDGIVNWQGGELQGASNVSINAGGSVTMSGVSTKTVRNRSIENYGTLTFGGTGAFSGWNGAVLTNRGTGLMLVTTEADMVWTSGGQPTFNNEGTLTRSSGTLTFDIGWLFNNTGTVNVQTGSTEFETGSHTGAFNASSGTELRFSGSHTLSSGSSLNGAGTATFVTGTTSMAGTWNLTGNPTFAGGTTTISGAIASFGNSLTTNGGNVTFSTYPTAALQSLNINSGTVTFSSGTPLTFSSVAMVGGGLAGSDDITITGMLQWDAGTISGASTLTLNSGCTTTMGTGSSKHLSQRNLVNAGAVTWSNGTFLVSNASVVTNQSGATWAVQTNSGITWSSGSMPTFDNAGTLTISGTTGVLSVSTIFTNSGTVNINSGTLSLGLGGNHTGTFSVSSLTALRLAGGSHFFSSGSLSGAGSLEVTSGSVVIAGDYNLSGAPLFSGGTTTFSGTISTFASTMTTGGSVSFSVHPGASLTGITVPGGTLTLQSGSPFNLTTLTLSGGTLTGTDNVTVSTTFNWTSGAISGTGSLTLPNTCTTTLSGAGSKSLTTRTVNHGGTLNWTGGVFLGSSSATFVNQTGANFNIQTNAGLTWSSGGVPLFNNSGTVTVSGTTGTTTISFQFNNGSLLDIQSGTLVLSQGGTQTDTMTVAATTHLRLQGTHNFNAIATVSGAGTFEVNSGATTMAGTYSVSGNTTFSGGTAVFSGPITAFGATTTISGTAVTFNTHPGATLTDVTLSAGSLTLTTGSPFNWNTLVVSGGTLTGTDNVTVSTTFNWSSGGISGASTLTLAGTCTSTWSGTGKTLTTRTVTNQGTITHTGGVVSGSSGAVLNNQAGATLNLQTNAGLTWSSGGTPILNNLGTIVQSGTTGSTSINFVVNNDNQLDINSGELALLQGGTSGGTFNVAATTTLRVAGTHTFTATSTLTGAGAFTVTSGTINIAGTYSIAGVPTFNAGTTTFSGTIAAFNASLVIATGIVNFNVYPGATLSTVSIAGGTANFSGGTGLTFDTVTMTSGTFTGTDTVNITTAFDWTLGTISGVANLNIGGGATFNLLTTGGRSLSQRFINNAGTTNWNGGNISGGQGAVFNNQTGASFNIAGTGSWFFNLGGTNTAFNNDGTVTKTSSGTTTLNPAFHNDGIVDINAGTLDLGGGGTNDGTYNVPSGSTLFFGGGAHTFNAASSIAGAGNVAGNSGTVAIDGGYNVTGSLTLSGASFTFNGASTIFAIGPVTITTGTLDLSSGTTLTLANVTQSGGTLTGTDQLDITTAYAWNGGTLSGAAVLNVNPGATLTMSTATAKSLSARTLTNSGTATWSGGTISSGQGAVLNNQGGATFTIDGANNFVFNLGGTQTIFNNAGTVTKSVATGTTSIAAVFNNSNAVNVTTGTLELSGGGSDSGAFSVSSGTTLNFLGGTHTLGGTSSIAGAGSVIFNSGTVTLDGTFNVTGGLTFSGATVTFNAPATISAIPSTVTVSSGTATFNTGETVPFTNVSLTGGTIGGTDAMTLSGTWSWTGGTLTGTGSLAINNGASMALTGATSKSLSQRAITNAGAITWSGGSLNSGLGATLTNQSGATFDIQGALSIFTNLGAPNMTVTNAGTITRSTATGTSGINAMLTNNGAVNVTAGTLQLAGTGTSTSTGAYTAASGTTLIFGGGGGTHNLGAGSSVSGAGSLEFSSGTTNVAGTWNVTGPVTTSSGTANFTAPVTAFGSTTTINSGSTLNLSTGGTVALTSVTLTGTLTGTDNVTVSGTMAWTSGTLSGSGALTVGSGATLNMTGASSKSLNGRAIANNGTMNWSGAGNINSGGGAVLTNAGTFAITNDASIFHNLGGGAPSLVNQGTLVKSASTGVTTLFIPLSNSGLADVQSGILRVSSNAFTQTAPGTLRLLVGGLTAGTQFGRLEVSGGAANLAGTLDVDMAGAYTPADGDTFQVLTYTSRTGDFATKSLLYTGGGFDYALNPTNITLTASSTGVSISKSGPATANAGSTITYSITVNNAGPDPASTVEVTDTLPAGSTFSSVTPPAGWNCTGTGPVVCTIASMPVGSAAISLAVVTPAASGNITNNVAVTATNDTSTGDNNASAMTTLSTLADLSLALTGSPASVAVNGALTWTATVTNGGPSTATGVTAQIKLPPGQTAGTITPSTGTCNGTTTINCSFGTLANGAGANVAITTTATVGGTMIAQGQTSATEADPNGTNNAVQSSVTVTGSQTMIVSNANASGSGSFVQAIFDANGGVCAPSPCNIHFNVSPLAAIPAGLPSVTVPVNIDGTTQPGYSGTPLIQIDGSAANPGSFALILAGSGSTVRGLSIHDFTGPGAAAIGVDPGATGVRLLGNTTYANSFGIDLGLDGPTANDAGDPDTGANNLQNAPVISSAILNGGNLTITATVDSPGAGTMALEVFRASGSGEGDLLIGSACIATPVTNATFTIPNGGLTAGQSIVATATSYGAACGTVADGTSEYSAAFATTGCTPPNTTITAANAVCPSTGGHAASVTPIAGATYAWTITNGAITSATNTSGITYTAGASGTTTLNVTITTLAGCANSGSHNVAITASPAATISSANTVCANSNANTASVPAQGGATYNWNLTNGTILSGASTDQITYAAAASGTVTLNVTVTAAGCTSNGTKNVTIVAAPNATISAPATVCANTGFIASVPSQAGATYNWTVTNGTITTSPATSSVGITAGPSGNVVVGVTVTLGGCSSAGTHTAAVTPLPPSAITAPTGTCPNTPGLTASVPTTAGATYAWTSTNGAITSNTNTSSITFTSGASGTTTLSVTVTSNGCSSTSTHNVAITANPASSISAPASTCANTPGNTASVPSQAGATYAWSITNGTITSAANGNGIAFTAGASGTTTVSVTVTANGCTTTGSHNVAITPPPNTTISAAASVCANSTGNTASVSAQAGATYNWTITNGNITSATGANAITFEAGPSGNVTLGVTVSVGGCTNNGTHTVATTSAAAGTTITAPSATCPSTAGLTASVPSVAGATYAWAIANGTITSATNTNAITFNAGSSGTTTLTANVTAGGCTSTATHNVTIVANPAATITAPSSVCASAAGNTASVAAQAGATYNWSISGGTITSATNTNAITFTAGASGSVTLNVTVAAGSCTSNGSTTIPIVSSLAVAIAGPNSACPNTPFTLDAGPGFSTYAWSNGASTQTITVAQSVATTYTVTVTNGGCSAQASKTVALDPAPLATITAPATVDPNTTGNTASVAAQTGASYNWTIVNGTITAGQHTNAITFTAGGSGSVDFGVAVTIGACSANGSASSAITGTAPIEADLLVTKSAPASVDAGQTFTYTLGIINNGPSNATSVTINDDLPAGLTVVGVNSGWSCTNTTTAVRCTGQTAVLGPNSPITITVRAPSAQNVTVTNTATITSATTDPNPANNSASATTQIVFTPTCATAPPVLESPANNATVNSPVTFSWSAIPGATFELWLGNTLAGSTTNTSLTLPVASGPNQWHVVARLGGGCEALTSERRSFTVPTAPSCPSAAPLVTSPLPNSVVDAPLTVRWNAVAQAVGYRVWLIVGTQAAQDVGTTGASATSLTIDAPPGSITLYVEALFGGCPTTESSRVTVTVAAPDPCLNRGASTLVAPANNAVHNGSSVEFRWTAPLRAADEYRLWVAVNGAAPQLLGVTEETSLRVVLDRGDVAWFVENVYDGCPSTESARFRFTIPAAQLCNDTRPEPQQPANNATVTNANVTFAWEGVENAVGYELWLALEDGAPTLLGTTTATTLTREVPAGELEWFVRARVDRCDPRDSRKSKLTYQPPPSCVSNNRPVAESPEEGADVASPIDFRWSTPAGATRYELYVIRGNNPAALAGSSTTNGIDGVALAPGRVRWFVRAFFAQGCPPLDSIDQELDVVAPPPACTPLSAPVVTAPGQISSGVAFRIRWNSVPGATSYQLLIAGNADFNAAESFTTTGTEHELVRTNTLNAAVPVFAKVRAIDANCATPSVSLYGPTAGIFVLPTFSNDASLPASAPATVTLTIALGPELAGQTFTAVPTQPWLTVSPASGVIGATGTTLTVTANTATLPLGASLGSITVTTTAPATNGIKGNATTTTTKPVTISLVSPVTPVSRNAPPPDSMIIPAVASADGINAHFQSDVRVTNASAVATKYQITFTPSGEGLTSSKATTISIDPGRTVALDDVLKSWFGTGGASTTGTLEVRPLTSSTTRSSFASSRTFNATTNGTFGQYIPAIPFQNFVGRANGLLSLQQIAHSSQYRTNLGIVEASGEPANVTVTVFGQGGTKLTSFPVALKGGQHTQLNSFLANQGITSLSDGRVEVQVTSGNGKVTAYASVLDNATADPLLVTPVALSDAGNTKWVVPGVADLRNGLANWQTDLRVFNASTTDVDATLTFHSQNGGEPRVATLTIPAGEVRNLDKTLTTVFNAPNDGGAVHITTPASSRLIATARTYNQTSSGTYGQFISAVTPAEAAAVGTRALQLLQVEESSRYRSNIGLAEVTGKPVTLELSMITADAKSTAVLTVDLAPNEFRQLGGILRALGPEVHNARVTVRAISGEGRVAAYASVVDMTTQDPTYVPAQ